MIIVIDYRAGNLYNVGLALKHLGVEYAFSSDPDEIKAAEKVILPGVGSARSAMQSLEERGLCRVIRSLRQPFLGICLGLQLLFENSAEENVKCLGIIPGSVERFSHHEVKVPHMGWNEVCWESERLGKSGKDLLRGIPAKEFFYFVHSYFAPLSDRFTLAVTEYSSLFSSAVVRDNFYGFQFHPERSGELGLRLLHNFVKL